MNSSTYEPQVRPLLGVADVAEILGISPASIYKRRSIGEPMPPAVRIGSVLRWRPSDVEQFLEDQLERSA